MASNRDFLIGNLQTSASLDGRYEQIACVNYDPTLKKKMQGNFSLVFRAWDALSERKVAIKFFDPEQAKMASPYRLQAFAREPELLKALLGKHRCLQLVSDLKTHMISVGASEGTPSFEVPFQYFVVEWLDDKIDQYFQIQESYSVSTKLKLFRDVLLAVEALHRYEVHHRDLKPENFRAYLDHMKRIVVAIDLGTAARSDSHSLMQDYACPVGDIRYSPPEAYCGLVGCRHLARFIDYYSLGCMLFELFSQSFFWSELQRSRAFDGTCAALNHLLMDVKELDARMKIFNMHVGRFAHAVQLPNFSSFSIQAPTAIIDLLDKALGGLVAFDYRNRVASLEETRKLIDICIRILDNRLEEDLRTQRRQQYRRNRFEKLRQREIQLSEYLKDTKRIQDK